MSVFREADDCRHFLDCLRDAAVRREVAIHAYVLMPDHVHLLATPATAAALGQMIQSLGRRYVRWFNDRYSRSGSLWQGRYRSAMIDPEPYLLALCRHLESNPVRSGLVSDAVAYPWSSLHHHLGLATDPIITDHPIIWALGNTPFERQSAYRDFFREAEDPAQVAAIRQATARGWPIGSPACLREMEKTSNRSLSPGPRGRAKRPHSSKSK